MKTKFLLIAIILVIFGCYKADEATTKESIKTSYEQKESVILDDIILSNSGERAGITPTTMFFKTSGTTDNYYVHNGRGVRVFEIINLNQVDSIRYDRTSPGFARFIKNRVITNVVNYDITFYFKDSTIHKQNYLSELIKDNYTDTDVSGGLIHSLAKVKITTFTRNDKERVLYQLPYAPQRSTWRYKYLRHTDGIFIDEEFKEPENSTQNFWMPLNIY